MDEYQATLEFLYNSMPAFERQGTQGYKPGLERVRALARAFHEPQSRFPSIHIAGTNGKGSTAHTLAAILQCSGYKTGLFTSPHLETFNERIRIDGRMIDSQKVVEFVDRYRQLELPIEPSFFELTTVMAFDYFASEKVDVAVIETGLGGRLDSTNILNPLLSVITNVDYDHTDLLGNTLHEIAREKAGIIKPGRPIVVSEADGEVRETFAGVACANGSDMIFASDMDEIISSIPAKGEYVTRSFGHIRGVLTGECQLANARGILESVKQLRKSGYRIPDEAVREGFLKVTEITGLKGRWTERALPGGISLVYDTGHNPAGWKYITDRLSSRTGRVRLVLGFVADKDVLAILRMLSSKMPLGTKYYLTRPESHRALDVESLAVMASREGLEVADVNTDCKAAFNKAKEDAAIGDTLFVGGSNYLIGKLLSFLSPPAHSSAEP